MAQASASASKDPGWHSPSFSPSLDFLVDVGLEQPDALARTTVTISSAGDADGEPDAAERRKPSSSSESFYVMLVDELVRTVKDKGERHLLSPSEFDALERFQALSCASFACCSIPLERDRPITPWSGPLRACQTSS